MRLSRPVLAWFVILFCCVSLIANDKKDQGPESSTDFLVLKDESGKPIRNAAVILHPVSKNGKQAKTGFELKTDADGKTHFDGIPYGPIRVQVIAPGFQTFGDDYQISQAQQQITIRLKRPQGQYSIYDNNNPNGNSGAGIIPKTAPQQ